MNYPILLGSSSLGLVAFGTDLDKANQLLKRLKPFQFSVQAEGIFIPCPNSQGSENSTQGAGYVLKK